MIAADTEKQSGGSQNQHKWYNVRFLEWEHRPCGYMHQYFQKSSV